MINGMAFKRHANDAKDIHTVLRKSPEDIAESLEIMMVETRILDDARTALRQACCIIRGEPVKEDISITVKKSVYVLGILKARWIANQIPARVAICERAIQLIESKINAST